MDTRKRPLTAISKLTLAIALTLPAHAALTISSTAPTGSFVSQPVAGSFTRTGPGPGPRGQSFTVGSAGGSNTGFNLNTVTMQKDVNQTFDANDSVTIQLFQWNPSNDANDMTEWVKGDGTGDADLYNGTGMSVMASQTFLLGASTIDDNEYLHFGFDSPIFLAQNTAFGFMMTYANGGTGAGYIQLYVAAGDDSGFYGQLLSATSTANDFNTTASGGQDVKFYLDGVAAVPEPSIASLLGLMGAGFLLRRRR